MDKEKLKVMIEKINKFREYLDYIEEHYSNVQKAWKIINKKCKGKSFRFMGDDFIWHNIDKNVKMHDMSKLSTEEFTQYRQYFFPCDYESKNEDIFNKAWEHHKSNNTHHWQNWVSNKLDEHCLVEMIIDWMAMGMKFNDTAKSYYEKNKSEINLPKWAIDLMYEIFECVYSE